MRHRHHRTRHRRATFVGDHAGDVEGLPGWRWRRRLPGCGRLRHCRWFRWPAAIAGQQHRRQEDREGCPTERVHLDDSSGAWRRSPSQRDGMILRAAVPGRFVPVCLAVEVQEVTVERPAEPGNRYDAVNGAKESELLRGAQTIEDVGPRPPAIVRVADNRSAAECAARGVPGTSCRELKRGWTPVATCKRGA